MTLEQLVHNIIALLELDQPETDLATQQVLGMIKISAIGELIKLSPPDAQDKIKSYLGPSPTPEQFQEVFDSVLEQDFDTTTLHQATTQATLYVLDRYIEIMFAGTTQETRQKLSELLAQADGESTREITRTRL